MEMKQMSELLHLLKLYRDNLHERGFTSLGNRLTEDIIECVQDDILDWTRDGEFSRR